MNQAIIRLFIIVLKVIRILFKSKDDLITENLALRQQLATCKTKGIKPRLSDMDRSFWVALRKVPSNWADALIIVKPETVIDWNRRRFKKYWWRKSSINRRQGRKRTDQEIVSLIRQMATNNNWGAPYPPGVQPLTGDNEEVVQCPGLTPQRFPEAHQRVRKILSERRSVLDDLAHLLLQKETVQGEELRKMLSESTPAMTTTSPGRPS
jgi:hypothetical protein